MNETVTLYFQREGFWDMTFSDWIGIGGILITIVLAGIILWAEITIKRRWDTLRLTPDELKAFWADIKEQTIFVPYNHYQVSIISREGNLAKGEIKGRPPALDLEHGLIMWHKPKEGYLAPTTIIVFDFKNAINMGIVDDEFVVAIRDSAIIAILSNNKDGVYKKDSIIS